MVREELLILASCLLRPISRNSVLVEFRVRRFAVIQEEIRSRAAHPDSPGKKGSFNVCVCVYFEQFDGRVCRIHSQGSAAINMCTVVICNKTALSYLCQLFSSICHAVVSTNVRITLF